MTQKIQIIIGGQTHQVEYDPGESLLDTAIRNGLNPPYSCMEGVCSACLAQVQAGEVEYPDDTVLDEDEVKSGRILTCQAKPKKRQEGAALPAGPILTINYDAV